MNERFLKSRWIFVYHKNNRDIVFNSNNLEIYFADKELVNLLKLFRKPRELREVFFIFSKYKKRRKSRKSIQNILRILLDSNILVSENKNELSEHSKWILNQIEKRKKEIGKILKLNALRVVLTEKCNFQCTYCFVKQRQKKLSNRISWENFKKSIDLLAKLNKKGHIEIHFFGGEPLIEFPLIARAVSYINNLIKKDIINSAFYAITTNATLMNKDMAKFFKNNHFLVSVSIDGWEKLHNENRRYLDGRGTFHNSVKALQILQKFKNDIGILVTPTKETVKYLSRACEYIVKKLRCNYITINTPQPVNGNWEISGQVFAEEVKRCLEIAKKNKAVITTLGTRVLYALDEKVPLILSCSKFQNNFTGTLTTKGKISPCIVSWNLGQILTPLEKFNYKGEFTKWKLTPPYFFKKCLSCPAMNVCGGPCPLEIYDMKKNSRPINHERCRFFRNFLGCALWYEV
ncbi:MAG: radical SAM protein [Patescibacteria group bacterium]